MNVNEWLLNENDKRNERVCECFWEKETNQERRGKRSRGPSFSLKPEGKRLVASQVVTMD